MFLIMADVRARMHHQLPSKQTISQADHFVADLVSRKDSTPHVHV
jgi:hypothetical protein